MNKKIFISFLPVLIVLVLPFNSHASDDRKNAATIPPVANFTANKTTICVGDSITFTDLSANNPTAWKWTFTGGTPPTSITQNETVTYNTAGSFTVKLVVSNIAGADSMTKVNYITVNPLPVIAVSGNDSICFGNSTTLTASGATNYIWAPSSGLSCNLCASPIAMPTMTTIYTIIGTTNGCSNAITYTVYVEQPPTVAASTSTPVICAGSQSAALSAVGSPSGGTYVWQPCNKVGQSILDTPATTTVYTVYYTNVCGTATDTVRVTVSPEPRVVFFADFKSGCEPFCVQFTGVNTTPNAKITSWSWDFGDGGTSTKQNPGYCYKTPGTYTVTLTATTAVCSSQSSIADYITVYALPKASFDYTPNPATILDPVISFTDKSTGASAINYWAWNFGDTNIFTSGSRFPYHTYTDTGTYCVQLAISDIHGCVDTNKQCFDINSQYSFYIPSSFTPNGDGVNDYFMPVGTDVGLFEMYIFDRWGMQLFHTTDFSSLGWDGKVKNSNRICQEDVYVYVINASDKKGNLHHFTGALYLVK